jgi:GNAT superfamily N-acetyltransferase
MDQFIHANHLEKKSGTVEALLSHIAVDTISAAIWDTDRNYALGFGFGAMEGDYVGCFDIFVRQEARGLGYGKAIMESLLGVAHGAGANQAYLQVMDDNRVAKGLYDSLAFKPLYSYHYRIKENTEATA